MLPLAVSLKGAKIKGTPCFEMHSSFLSKLPGESNVYLPEKDEEVTLPVYLNSGLLKS